MDSRVIPAPTDCYQEHFILLIIYMCGVLNFLIIFLIQLASNSRLRPLQADLHNYLFANLNLATLSTKVLYINITFLSFLFERLAFVNVQTNRQTDKNLQIIILDSITIQISHMCIFHVQTALSLSHISSSYLLVYVSIWL